MSQVIGRALLVTVVAIVVAAVLDLPGKPTRADPNGPQVTVINATANPVPATLPTHIGQPAASILNLRCTNFSGPLCSDFRRTHLDGTEDNSAFSIPPGTLFVITDVNWSASAAAGTDVRFFIQSGAPSIRYAQSAVTNSGSYVATADHFTTGFVFSAMPQFVITSFSVITPLSVTVQGYLVSQ